MSTLDTIDSMAYEVARQLAAKQDDLIRGAISERLGTADWRVEDMLGRLTKTQERGSVSWVWALDGSPLLEIWPAENSVTNEAGVDRMNWSVKYRRLEF